MDHLQRKVTGSVKEFSADVKKLLDHGIVHEPDAIATIVTNFLPQFYPDLHFFEEGYYVENAQDGKPILVVSPDGSLRYTEETPAAFAIEIKCPSPEIKFVAPVHYKPPARYVPQFLSEMHALNCDHLLFISYSLETTVVHKIKFDEDLWKCLSQELEIVHEQVWNGKAIKGGWKNLNDIKQRIKLFLENNCSFLCEIPSVSATKSVCSSQVSSSTHFNTHSASSITTPPHEVTLKDMLQVLNNTKECIHESYHLKKEPATEILVWVTSDTNRLQKSESYHAVPIAWGLKGNRFTADQFRKSCIHVLEAMQQQGLYTPVLCLDGQWNNLVVRDSNGAPLTLIQLQKDVYRKAISTSKAEIVKHLEKITEAHEVMRSSLHEGVLEFWWSTKDDTRVLNIGKCPSDVPKSQICKGASDAMKKKKTTQRKKPRSKVIYIPPTSINEYVLGDIPEEEQNDLSDEMLQSIEIINAIVTVEQETNEDDVDLNHEPEATDEMEDEMEATECDVNETSTVQNDSQEQEVNSTKDTKDDNDPCEKQLDEYLSRMLSSLQNDSSLKKCDHWKGLDVSTFSSYFKTQSTVNRRFLLPELKIMAGEISQHIEEKGFSLNEKSRKDSYITVMCTIFSRNSPKSNQKQPTQTCQDAPISGKQLCNSLPKEVLNILYAELIWPEELRQFRSSSGFLQKLKVEDIGSIEFYSKPEFVASLDHYLFTMLDNHHMHANTRVKVCSSGIPACNIDREAFLKVAKNSKHNGSKLNIALVEDLLDKQSSDYALRTFSEDVEKALHDLGEPETEAFVR